MIDGAEYVQIVFQDWKRTNCVLPISLTLKQEVGRLYKADLVEEMKS